MIARIAHSSPMPHFAFLPIFYVSGLIFGVVS